MGLKAKDRYSLSDNVIETLIDPIFTKAVKNRQAIKNMMLSLFDTNQLELVIELLHMKEKFVPLTRDSYVELLKPKSYWPGDKYELDKLADMGLLSPNGNPYACVKNDDSWDDQVFNPYNQKFKVKVLILDDDGKMIEEKTTETVDVEDIKQVKQNEIKYFKATSK